VCLDEYQLRASLSVPSHGYGCYLAIQEAFFNSLLEDVIAEYCHEKVLDKSWTAKTEKENRAIYALLVRVVGNIPVSELTHAVARDYKQTLMKLPPSLNKSSLYRSKTLEQILRMNPDPMATTTVNKNLVRASSLFEWATRHGYMDKNYFEALSLKNTKRADEERSTFTREDLVRIFSHTPYATHRFVHPYYYWLPLLGLYTGARLEEICQLYLDDIYQEEGIWVISINDQGDKKLKTKSSKRIIPVHPKLIALGLPAYVQTLKDRKQIRLFPELKKGRDGYSQAASKWFSRFREKIGLHNLNPPKDFHSFRHTLVTELKNKSIPEVEVAAITGHSASGITYGRYGKSYDIKKTT
jgi:integrase